MLARRRTSSVVSSLRAVLAVPTPDRGARAGTGSLRAVLADGARGSWWTSVDLAQAAVAVDGSPIATAAALVVDRRGRLVR